MIRTKCLRCGKGQNSADTFGCDYVVFLRRATGGSTGFGYSYSEASVVEGGRNEIVDRGLCFSCAREVTAQRRQTLQPQAEPALTVRPAETQAERDRDLALRLGGLLLVERAVAAEYAASEGRPWPERIAVKVRLDAARAATRAEMTGGAK